MCNRRSWGNKLKQRHSARFPVYKALRDTFLDWLFVRCFHRVIGSVSAIRFPTFFFSFIIFPRRILPHVLEENQTVGTNYQKQHYSFFFLSTPVRKKKYWNRDLFTNILRVTPTKKRHRTKQKMRRDSYLANLTISLQSNQPAGRRGAWSRRGQVKSKYQTPANNVRLWRWKPRWLSQGNTSTTREQTRHL